VSSIQSPLSLTASVLERKKQSRNKYTSSDAVRMVVVNGLKPTEALRACLNPCSRQRLSYLLAKVGDNELHFEQMHNDTLPVLLDNSFEDVVSSLTPNSIETISTSKESVQPNTPPNKNRSSCRVSDKKKGAPVDLSSPISNRTQDSAVVSLISTEGLSSCSRVRRSTTMISKERAILNKRKREEESVYNIALTAAIRRFSFANEMKLANKTFESCRNIVSEINIKYLSNFEHKITRTTLQRYFKKGWDKQARKGPPSKISKVLIEAIVLHVGMKQVSGTGEAKAKDIMSIISAAVKNTKHQDSVNVKYAYEKIRLIEAERMQNSSIRGVEDIRCQWTTYEKLNQWFDDAKPVLLKYKFAEDRKVMLNIMNFYCLFICS